MLLRILCCRYYSVNVACTLSHIGIKLGSCSMTFVSVVNRNTREQSIRKSPKMQHHRDVPTQTVADLRMTGGCRRARWMIVWGCPRVRWMIIWANLRGKAGTAIVIWMCHPLAIRCLTTTRFCTSSGHVVEHVKGRIRYAFYVLPVGRRLHYSES